MIDEPPERFLMTPRQHREWAERARRHDRPDLALQHEQLARVIEKIAQEQAEHRDDPVPTYGLFRLAPSERPVFAAHRSNILGSGIAPRPE